jgi:hypothetical protein
VFDLSRPRRRLRTLGPRSLYYNFGILAAIGLMTGGASGQEVLYGMNDVGQVPGGPDEIVRIDTATGVADRFHVFSTGLKDLESLTFEARANVAWTTNGSVLVRLALPSWAPTTIGDTGYKDIDGLAVQPGTGVLFGVTYGGNDLIKIDKTTAACTLVNGHVEEGSRLEDLAFDSGGRLYILTSNALTQYDPDTGKRISKVKTQGATSLESLVWWSAGGTFLSAGDRGIFKDLLTLNRTTGQCTYVSATLHSGFKDIEALALIPATPIVPVEMQALGAFRAGDGAHLAWEARQDNLDFIVQRAFASQGPWQTLSTVRDPASGRSGFWRYEHVDVEAAGAGLANRALQYRVGAADAAGQYTWLEFHLDAIPAAGVRLLPNAPNPFNPTTAFEVRLGKPARVAVRLYDIQGRLVRSLRTPALEPGTHSVVWDGRDESGRSVPAGVYPYVVSAGQRTLRGRAVLVK